MLTEIDKRLDKSIYLYIIQRLTTDNSKWIYIPLTKVWFRWATMVSYALTVLSPLELPCSQPRSPRRVLCAHLAVSLEITFFPTLISIPCIMYSCTVSLNTYHLCFVIIVSIDVRALCFVLTVLSPLTSALYVIHLPCCLPWRSPRLSAAFGPRGWFHWKLLCLVWSRRICSETRLICTDMLFLHA